MYYAKSNNYRQRCRLDGRCPHCGKPCAPYAECADRREYKRAWHKARSGKQRGSYKTNPDAKRRQPRPRLPLVWNE
jgi:hypothetical protein